MPTLPAVPNVIKFQMLCTNSTSGHHIVNNFHYAYTGGAPSIADLNSAATALFNFFAAMAPDFATTTSVISCTAIDLNSSTGNEVTYTPAAVVGTAPTPVMDAANAGVINWKIARRYRGGKPKTFIGGLGGGLIQDVIHLNASFTTTLQTFATALLTTGSGGMLKTFGGLTLTNMVNVSYYSGFTNYTKPNGREASRPTLRAAPVVDVISNYVVNPVFGQQRRRRLAS